jgi:hypothetical protein
MPVSRIYTGLQGCLLDAWFNVSLNTLACERLNQQNGCYNAIFAHQDIVGSARRGGGHAF